MITRPWPSMLRTVWGDDPRFRQQYFSQVPGSYFTGDGARVDGDGYFWIAGRIDDVINVAGHRLGTMEIETPWSRTPRWPRPPSLAGPTPSRAPASWPS